MLFRFLTDVQKRLHHTPPKGDGERQALAHRSYTGSTGKHLLCCTPNKDLYLPLPLGGILHAVVLQGDEMTFLCFTRHSFGNLFNVYVKCVSVYKTKSLGYTADPRTGKLKAKKVDNHTVGYCEVFFANAHPYNLHPLFQDAKQITRESFDRVGLDGGLSYTGGFNEMADIIGQSIFE